ncbi:hypothetical protein SPRG_21511 [Saprolegnia parasitica CBS 223.65]|uniref:PHD-type domain-containing protein n=1 Tax=Saprolegnia parasitica (strain CBS 223.65) TaxID=695850 RepID=A0A067BX19_SAPPC|nr:hypothetical protein SPRG_21511 [Saprolegnia parasitica CBS 223.65]KDO18846.1 hypothetical protein SPRG_21511 [Saprolegnia parasitica CBS 223.65]|eukprot:XP_012210449.1 hypothetical protein SPRG_21511 [Saprolegnia parasitica CBS 223.65]
MDEDAPCRVCGKTDDEEFLVLCDGCDAPFHTFCHHGCVCCQEKPRNNFNKKFAVPDGDWFCKFCAGHIPAPKGKPLSRIFAWGDNEDGQLGLGDADLLLQATPTLVPSLAGLSVRDVACGENFTVVLANEGDAYSVGTGVSGQLGHNDVTSEKDATPTKVPTLPTIKKLFGGWNHAFALEFAASIPEKPERVTPTARGRGAKAKGGAAPRPPRPSGPKSK